MVKEEAGGGGEEVSVHSYQAAKQEEVGTKLLQSLHLHEYDREFLMWCFSSVFVLKKSTSQIQLSQSSFCFLALIYEALLNLAISFILHYFSPFLHHFITLILSCVCSF